MPAAPPWGRCPRLGAGGRSPAAAVAGVCPRAVVAADFDGDGDLDLAVANLYSSTVSVLPGNGNGTFAAKVDYATANVPSTTAIADFDEDGHPDLAIATEYVDAASVLINTGGKPPAAVEPEPASAGALALGVGPNPARQRASLRFRLPEAAEASLAVFDLSGPRVATLLDRAPRPGGTQQAPLATAGWRAGLYLCRLTSGGLTAQTKLVVVQ